MTTPQLAATLIEQNDEVMRQRGGSAWIVLKEDTLDVRFLEEGGELPDPDGDPASLGPHVLPQRPETSRRLRVSRPGGRRRRWRGMTPGHRNRSCWPRR